MGLFKKRKKKRDMGSFLEGYLTEETPKESVHQVQHQALSCCEMMISLSRELEETKKEYQLVTDYLSDIQMLEELPEHEMTRLRDTAKNIISLDKARNEFVNKEQRLSDAQYMQMEQLEAEIPGDIRRMQANESYQSMIKRDMDNLEGEKSEWEYYLASLMKEKKMLKIGLFLLLPVFAAGVCILGYLQYVQYRDVLLWSMIFILAATVAGGGGVLRFQRDGREIKRAKASINRAITLTNQMKAKYVNVTNAVDYAIEKFHVRNSMELNYLWEQYMEAVKEREAAERTNEDLEYFTSKLVRDLKQYKMYDAAIWVHQANALVDRKEMVEVKHYLLVRRQKLRARMEQQIKEIREAKQQMLLLMREEKEYKKEIMEVLASIDQLCGS
ncbi:MAG: hypothetical protein HFI76_02945 [Lachnospiraceae bacterium]|jgi:thiamine phosphate synthase YjbQ (UPF0047 family)|nr:hypothetical protein [Lachnospiraceae bacterium]